MQNDATTEAAQLAAPAPGDTAAEPASSETAATVDWKAEAEKWKALSRRNEERARANADKARRLDEIEERSKTETQKAVENYQDRKSVV